MSAGAGQRKRTQSTFDVKLAKDDQGRAFFAMLASKIKLAASACSALSFRGLAVSCLGVLLFQWKILYFTPKLRCILARVLLRPYTMKL